MNAQKLLTDLMKPTSTYTDALLERILEATVREVLSVFRMPLDAEIRRKDAGRPRGEVMVVTGFSGDLQGFLCIDWEADLAFDIASRRMGTEAMEFDRQMREMLEEIGAAVAGHFRSKLRNMGWTCDLSPTAVISGSEYHFHTKRGFHHVEFAITMNGKPIWVALNLRKS